MAKKRAARGGGKSQAIRDYLGKNPDAGPKQAVEALAAQGVNVSRALVGVVKYKSGPKRRKVTRKRKVRRARTRAAAPRTTRTDGLTSDDLFEAKKLAERMGGIAEARRALETLEQLQ